MAEFNIVNYLGSILGYPIPKETVERIVRERGLTDIDDWADVPRRERNLAIADMLMFIFTSPNNTGNRSRQHGDFSVTIGGIQLYNKSEIYSLMMRLYQNPDEELWEALANIGGCQWMD